MTTLPDYTTELARELRAAAGLSQAAMAEACHLAGGRQAWSDIERGRRPSAPVWAWALAVGGQHPQWIRRLPTPPKAA